MSKKCRTLWHEAHLEVNMLKTPGVRTTFGRPDVVQMSKKYMPLWHEAPLQVKSAQKLRALSHFRRSDVVFLQIDGYRIEIDRWMDSC